MGNNSGMSMGMKGPEHSWYYGSCKEKCQEHTQARYDGSCVDLHMCPPADDLNCNMDEGANCFTLEVAPGLHKEACLKCNEGTVKTNMMECVTPLPDTQVDDCKNNINEKCNKCGFSKFMAAYKMMHPDPVDPNTATPATPTAGTV